MLLLPAMDGGSFWLHDAMRFVIFTIVNSLRPLTSPATLMVIESFTPEPAAKTGTLNNGTPCSSVFG